MAAFGGANGSDAVMHGVQLDHEPADECPSLFSRLGDIRQPTLVVCGDQDFCTPVALSEEITHAIPNSELVIVPDCGHLVEHEKGQEFFEIVSTFIARHR